MFVWENDSEEAKAVKREELDPIEDDILEKLSKDSKIKREDIEKFIKKNEEDAFEYLIVANYLLKHKE